MSREICWICWCSYDDDGTCGCPGFAVKTLLTNEGALENTHPLETGTAAELRRLHAQVAQDEAMLQQALYALEYASDMTKPDDLQECDCTICTSIDALRERLAKTTDNLARCPNCNGPADNGHDREVPPNPYWCSKCMES